MMRLLLSLLLGLTLGIGAGIYIGWVQAPVEYIDSPLGALDQDHLDDYTVMIAAGFSADGDLTGAVDRLRKLNVPSVPIYVQTVTERFISQGRNVEDIRRLVALAEAMGRLTPLMEAYRAVLPAS
jgi:hypothetical protein